MGGRKLNSSVWISSSLTIALFFISAIAGAGVIPFGSATVDQVAYGIDRTSEQGRQAVELLHEAIAQVGEGKIDAAAERLKEARKLQPQLPSETLMLARLFLAGGQRQDGLRRLEAAAAEAPDDPSPHLTLGQVALNDRRFSDARLQFSESLKLKKPATWKPLQVTHFEANCISGLSEVCETLGEWKQAASWLARLKPMNFEESRTHFRLARTFVALSEVDSARIELALAVEKDQKLLSADLQLGHLLYQFGHWEKAVDSYKAAVAQAPVSAAVSLAVAKVFIDRGELAEGVPLLVEAEKTQSQDPDVRYLRAIVERCQGNAARAEQILSGLHDAHPANIQVSNQLTLVLAEQSEEQKRVRAFEMAKVNLRQYPRLAAAQATMGWILHLRGEDREAEKLLTSAVTMGEATSDMVFQLAKVLVSLGRQPQAEQLLEDALRAPGLFIARKPAELLLSNVRRQIEQK